VTKIVWDQGFKRSYKKRIANDQRLKESFWEAFEEFSRNPFSKKLRTHMMTWEDILPAKASRKPPIVIALQQLSIWPINTFY
jgi:mRNA-degrading endonuclease YafQ of YafQ-DinJ toxin-antitoxin module